MTSQHLDKREDCEFNPSTEVEVEEVGKLSLAHKDSVIKLAVLPLSNRARVVVDLN